MQSLSQQRNSWAHCTSTRLGCSFKETSRKIETTFGNESKGNRVCKVRPCLIISVVSLSNRKSKGKLQRRRRRSISSFALGATMTRSDDKSVLLVNAYLDGELDPANALGVTQQMHKEPAIASEAERIKAL